VRSRKGKGRSWRRHRLRLALLGLVLLCPIVALNLAVAFFGHTLVFPLSPWHLRDKARALAMYVVHRPGCLLRGEADLDAAIARAEHRHRLPRGLLAALVEIESSRRAHRISPAGAMGPAQLTPDTARFLGVSDPFDPASGVEGGARYLGAQLRRFGDVRLALAAYNAGPGAVRGGVPRNGETEFYVEKVMRAWGRRTRASGSPPNARL
jgi:soluble lytic murein transglycosylase-like protein